MKQMGHMPDRYTAHEPNNRRDCPHNTLICRVAFSCSASRSCARIFSLRLVDTGLRHSTLLHASLKPPIVFRASWLSFQISIDGLLDLDIESLSRRLTMLG